MFRSLRRLVRDLTGRNDEVLVGHLLGQVDAARAGVVLALDAARGERSPEDTRASLGEVADRGDRHRDDLVAELAAVLAPPMDREDLFRLSRSVDDVLDNLVDLVRELALFGFDHEPPLDQPLEGVGRGLDALRSSIEALVDDPEAAQDGAREAKRNGIREAYQEGVAALLDDDQPVTAATIKRRMLLRRVDVVGLRLGEAADALVDGTIKRNT